MRILRIFLPVLAVSALLIPASGHADPYRWCAEYGGMGGGGTNCGFVTLEQCRATVSGIGGACVPNPFYTGSDRSTTGYGHHKRRHRDDYDR